MNKLQKRLLIASRIFVGVVFVYSGFVKAVDPLGSSYKFNDYFTAFHSHWATTFSFALSIILSISEFLVGAAVLLNLKLKISSWGALLFMAIFTPITFILALNNPVHDCGCFGDALILTNWQTFWKNVILLIPVGFIFIYRRKSDNILKSWEQWASVSAIILFISVVVNHSYHHLPLLDFRPYKVGVNIPANMIIPEGAPADVWKSSFIYSKNGEQKEFTLKNLPDSTWQFVDAKNVLIKKGYEPPIHDFTIATLEGDEITDLILASENYNFLLIAYNLDKFSTKSISAIENLMDYCKQNDYNFYGLTSSSAERVDEFINETGLPIDFYNTDEITLKTIIRANPGVILIKSGTILNKWHYKDIPDFNKIGMDLTSYSVSKYKKNADNYYILLLIVTAGLMITLYLLIRKIISK